MMPEQPWQYQPARDLGRPWPARLRQFPREPDMLVYALRALAAVPLRAFLRTYHRLRVVGREHLPRAGSFVIAANHSSHLDALCLISALPLARLHHTFPAAAQDYFFVSLSRLAPATIFVNAIPFAREAHLRASLDLCRQLLAAPGNILILFPEGTRTTTGALGEFRPGIGSLVAGTDVPVVPCAIQGAFRAWPKGAGFPRPYALRLVVGAPRRYAHLPPGKESSGRIASELRSAVQELSCQ
jgi:1-acyl-sn-glycerol-3-phosphate acyltransferase